MKFSIIVPVYNVELYLVECLNSLVNQTFDDYEIILVNDGSTDRSQEICEDYSKRYSKIKYYQKKNGGLSDTRNFGLEHAKGDYVVFVDSDDWIELEALRKFNVALSEPKDVLITRFVEAFPEVMKKKDDTFEDYLKLPFTNERALKWLMIHSYNTWPAQKNIISKNFIDRYNLRFKVGRLHEDVDWTARVCLYANSFQGFSDVWYYHRMARPGSITSSIKTKNIIDTIEMAASFFMDVKDDSSEKTSIIKDRIMKSVYAKLNQVKKCPYEERKQIITSIKKNEEIFAIAPKFKHLIFSKLMKILGPKTALDLLAKL